MNTMLLVSVFGRIDTDNNDRLNSVYDNLNFNIKIVTTDFSHRDKKYHNKVSKRNVDYLHVSSYKSNLSLARIFSHITFAVRLAIYLRKNLKKYQYLYCILPTPSSAFVCALYKRINKDIIFITDTIDIWPEGLLPLSKKYMYLLPFLFPWKLLSIYAYKKSDAIIAATKKYQEDCLKYNKSSFSDYYPLGIDIERNKSLLVGSKIGIVKSKDEIWIAYAGSLGNSYDFDSMIDAVLYLVTSGYNIKIKFLFIGGGDKNEKITKRLSNTKIPYLITGNLLYEDYLKYLSYCDIGFNIFINYKEVIQSYKFYDYVFSKMFVFNNLKGETADLIEEYSVGVNLDLSLHNFGAELLKIILDWQKLKDKTDQNCERLLNEKLDKKNIYNKLEEDLISLAS